MALTKPRASQIYNLDYKQATRVVTVSNIALSGGAPAVVDGVTLAVNDRILVTGQSTASQNGLYDVVTVGTGSNGTWVRTSDANNTGEVEAGMIVMVTEGAVYADTQWKLITNNPIVIGSTALVFTQNYSANSISGGTSNVTVYSNANVTISSAGTPNVLIVSSTGTVTSGTTSVTGNITGGNLVTVGQISATGNITGNYFIGNGSALTGIVASASAQILNGTSNVTVAGSSNVTVAVAGTTIATYATTGEYITGIISATGDITSSGNINGVNLNSTHADLAELYLADLEYSPGTVVEFGGTAEITITTKSHSSAVAGVVSTEPGHLMNSALIGTNTVAVALTGRVPCQVVGTIRKGDRLVSSSISGVATALDMTQYQPGCIIGKALENYDSIDNGIIEVAVGRF